MVHVKEVEIFKNLHLF